MQNDKINNKLDNDKPSNLNNGINKPNNKIQPNNLDNKPNNKIQLNNLNNNQNFRNARRNMMQQGAKMAANKVAGPLGGKAADVITKSKIGQKVMDDIGDKLTDMPKNINPINNMNPLKKVAPQGKSNIFGKMFDKKEKKEEQEEVSGEGEASVKLEKGVMKFAAIGTAGIGGCFTFIFLLLIVYIILSPLIYINNLINNVTSSVGNFFESLGNFLTFNGWCTNEECEERRQNDFYDEIQNVYEDYQSDKSVKLNVTLLTATLTYTDPFLTTTGGDESVTDLDDLNPSNYIDFKKSKEKIELLAEKMVKKICKDGDTGAEVDCSDSSVSNKVEEWKLDIEGYRQYLEDEFIRKFYYDNEQGSDIDIKVERAVQNIFDRVAAYEYYNSPFSSSSQFVANNTKVTILDCNNNLVLEEVSLYEYLQGVLYHEGYATGRSEEFLKVMAIVAKTYLYSINGATTDSMPSNLRIRSCQMNQIYCSVTEGCHKMNDSTNEAYNTIASGPDANGNYLNSPLSSDSETLQKIKNAIDSTFKEFIVKDNNFVMTQYRSSCSGTCDSSNNIMDQAVANDMIESGKSYKEVLEFFYTGEINEISISAYVYPLDLENNYVTSAFGWRVHPIDHCCRHHNGTDIGANTDDNIYAIADGVIVLNQYNSSYGNYTIIGHGNYDSTTDSYEYYSLYAHQVRLSQLVSVGENVSAGQLIGNVGTTGKSTGPHLHIEIYSIDNGIKIRQDPVEYFTGVQLTGMVGGQLYDSESSCTSSSGYNSCS